MKIQTEAKIAIALFLIFALGIVFARLYVVEQENQMHKKYIQPLPTPPHLKTSKTF